MEKPPLGRPTEQILRAAVFWIVGVYAINFFFLGFIIGPFDYDHLSAYYDLAWRFWRTSSLPPQYNPYLCGGRTLGGDPQLPIFHPLVLLVPILGPTLVIKWEMLAQLALGAYGLVGLLKRWNVSKAGIWWGLFLYLAGGGIVSRFLVGHVTMGFYTLYPLFVFLSYRLSEPGTNTLRLFCAYVGLFTYAGMYKPNFLIYGIPPLLVEVTTRALFKKQLKPLLFFIAATALSSGMNAATYLPSWKYFTDFPRLDGSEPRFIPIYAFFANLFLPLKAIPKAFYGSGFMQRHEYNIFLGPVALWFCWVAWRKPWTELRAEKAAMVALLVVSMLLGMGSTTEGLSLLPYTWFHSAWPGFKSIRVPVRLWFGAFFALILFSAYGFREVQSKGKWIAWIVVGILPMLLSATVNLFKTTIQKEQTQWSVSREYPDQITLSHTDHPSHAYAWIRKGVGIIDCVDNIEIKKSPDLKDGDTLAMEATPDTSSLIRWGDWNQIEVAAQGTSPFQIRLNLNHSPYWKFSSPTEATIVSKWGERLAIESHVSNLAGKLIFEQPYAREAMLASLGGCACFALFSAWVLGRKT